MVNLFGRLTTRVCRTARLTLAAGGLHVVVLVGEWRYVWIAVTQHGHRGNAAGEDTDRVEGALEGELVVGNLVGIASAAAGLHADQIPATATLGVRLRDSEVVLSLVAAQFLWFICLIAGGHLRDDSHETGAEEESGQQASPPGKSGTIEV